jgi:hypothetical protein
MTTSNVIVESIRQHLSEYGSQDAIMIIHPASLNKFVEEIRDPGVYASIMEKLSRNETDVRIYGLNVTIYRSFDIPQDKIIMHEQTN